MPGYRKPGKQEAYRSALGYVSSLATDYLCGGLAMRDTERWVENEYPYPKLSRADIRDVAAKAIRMERGRRLRTANDDKRDIHARLGQSDRAKLAELAERFGGQSQAIRHAIRALHETI